MRYVPRDLSALWKGHCSDWNGFTQMWCLLIACGESRGFWQVTGWLTHSFTESLVNSEIPADVMCNSEAVSVLALCFSEVWMSVCWLLDCSFFVYNSLSDITKKKTLAWQILQRNLPGRIRVYKLETSAIFLLLVYTIIARIRVHVCKLQKWHISEWKYLVYQYSEPYLF